MTDLIEQHCQDKIPVLLHGPADIYSLYLNRINLDRCWFLDRKHLHINNRPVYKDVILLDAKEGHPSHWKQKKPIYRPLARDIYDLKSDPYCAIILICYHVHHRCWNSRCVNPEHLIALRPEDHRAVHSGTPVAVFEAAYALEYAKRIADQEKAWELEAIAKEEARPFKRLQRWWSKQRETLCGLAFFVVYFMVITGLISICAGLAIDADRREALTRQERPKWTAKDEQALTERLAARAAEERELEKTNQ
jgi:hypothetical protein